MNEMVILESQSMRQKLCTDSNAATILDKVGTLILLEGTEFCTIKEVAAFYIVPVQTVKNLVFDHREELVDDGYKVLSKRELEKFLKETFKVPNRGLAIFPRRSVLRIGCLLRDSVVAKLVRSYLLNVEESLTITPKTQQTLQRMVNQLDQHAEQLIENAHQLGKHANQLTEHADELTGHAEQLKSQTRMIKVVVDEIYRNRSRIDDVESGVKANRDRIAALERLYKRQEQEPEVEYITQEQINILKRRVKEKGNPCRIWAKLRLHFDVTRYVFIPKNRFREVLDWLENYPS